VTVDILPDDVLLEIFDFCRPPELHSVTKITSLPSWSQSWKTLTQVCRRWRYIILGSPQRLHLRVLCTPTTPTRVLLDVWPPFPISIYSDSFNPGVDEQSIENLTAAVEYRDRTSEIYIRHINGPALERLIGAMDESLPNLTDFHLGSTDDSVPVLPETFLGGSAPHLRWFTLWGIPFPSFPVFSAAHTVHLHLFDIPNSGYISPDTMATCLATFPNLKHLGFGFRSPLSRPLQVGLPPLSHAVLPALTSMSFKGVSEYFEDFLARIHIPLLNWLEIEFFMDLILDIPMTHKLIDLAQGFEPPSHAWVMFDLKRAVIMLGSPPRIKLHIKCRERDWQLSSLAHVCRRHLALSSLVWNSLAFLSICPVCHCIGNTTWTLRSGSNFSTHSPLFGICTWLNNWCPLSLLP
jgi:hypothetical protein